MEQTYEQYIRKVLLSNITRNFNKAFSKSTHATVDIMHLKTALQQAYELGHKNGYQDGKADFAAMF